MDEVQLKVWVLCFLRAAKKHVCTVRFHGCSAPEVLLMWPKDLCMWVRGGRAVKGSERIFDISAYCKFSCYRGLASGLAELFVLYYGLRLYHTASHNNTHHWSKAWWFVICNTFLTSYRFSLFLNHLHFTMSCRVVRQNIQALIWSLNHKLDQWFV